MKNKSQQTLIEIKEAHDLLEKRMLSKDDEQLELIIDISKPLTPEEVLNIIEP